MTFTDLNNFEGLQFIPVNEFKQPLVKDWQVSIKKYDLSNCHSVGLVCGIPSGGVEVIDIDEKYSLDGKLFETYKNKIYESNKELLKKLVVQKTKNGGYHLIYRCHDIEGNLKLANRFTTDEEKQETYKKTYDTQVAKSIEDSQAKKVALKSSENDKVRVLIETRGIGGQIVCNPSIGYEFIFGDLYSISEITKDERDCLFSCARELNEVFEEIIISKTTKLEKTDGKSPFEDYDERGDVIGLLQTHGWQIVKEKGKKTHLIRPGTTSALTSGNFDHDKNWFSVFTTSTEFKTATAYKRYAVFAMLECNGDYSLASKKLLELGYGELKKTKKTETTSTRKIYSRIVEDDNDYSFLATNKDYDEYLQQVIDGTLVKGLTTGIPSLDEYFLFKEGNMVNINGIDNVGKSVWIWWLLLVASMYHGWKGIIFSSENTVGGFMRKMIQFYWGKPIRGDYPMNKQQYEIAKKFIEEHFTIIKAQEDLYNYKDIITMVKKAEKRDGNYRYCLVDPYNSLKIDLSGFSKLNTHEFHYEALSEMKAYGQQNKFGWYINHHAITGAARAKDGDKKYPLAPQKADTEGGQKVANKSDEFLTIHRLTQHPTDWNITDVYVRKVKDTDTGGRVSPFDSPIRFLMYKFGCGFKEYLDNSAREPIDPIMEWHYKNGTLVRPSEYGNKIIMGALNEPKEKDGFDYLESSSDAPF